MNNKNLIIGAVAVVLIFMAYKSKLNPLAGTITNQKIGVKIRVHPSWDNDDFGSSLKNSPRLSFFKKHPSNKSLTDVQFQLMERFEPDLRKAYDREFGGRDLALSKVPGEVPPTFENTFLYGVPALRVTAANGVLEEIVILNKNGKTIMISRDVQGDTKDTLYWAEAKKILDQAELL